MTKKDLLKKAYQNESNGMAIRVCDVQEFVYSHVCIPKGANRHPYADVLHEWVEGGNIQIDKIDCPNVNDYFCHKGVYRIKPSEPVYEYFVVDDKGVTDWMTIQEFESDNDFKFIAEKTKRERK